MKAFELLEHDNLSVVKMLTRGFDSIKISPKEVDVEFKKEVGSRKKECFNNAFKSMSNGSEYVLGFVFYHGIPIEHAWIKDSSGKYFDVTLDPKLQNGYISVSEFTFDEVMKYVEKNKSAPSLYDFNRFLRSGK